MNDTDLVLLFEQAKKTRENAFSSRSEHKIGASVLTIKDNIYGGCNIESNISGLGMCAERAAINNAIIHGEYAFKALLTYDLKHIIPCGACLQYLQEFSVEDLTVLTTDVYEQVEQYSLQELLPKGYISPNKLKKLEPFIGR